MGISIVTGISGQTMEGDAVASILDAHLASASWRTGGGGPAPGEPVASFTLAAASGNAPFTAVLTNTSTKGTADIDTAVLSFSDGRADITMTGATQEFTIQDPSTSVTVTLTVTDTGALSDSVSQTLTTNAVDSTPLLIGYNAWSTMWNSLGAYNPSGTSGPPDNMNPSVHTMVGQMYAQNNISGYSHDFQFLPQGAEYIDGTDAMNNINTTASEVMVLSCYGSSSGIMQTPATADGEGGWIDRMVTAAQACEARSIHPVVYQAWGSTDIKADYPNAKINTDALLAKHNVGIIRTGEIQKAINDDNTTYMTNVDNGRGKYEPPVDTFYSGDLSDAFHGSFAMAYMCSLATFKYLTGISAAANQFAVPTYYSVPAGIITLIKSKVDLIQVETFNGLLEAGSAPVANDFNISGTHDLESTANVVALSNLNDDVAIDTANLSINSITAGHFTSYSLVGEVFTYTPNDTFTGDSTVVFRYTDADTNVKDITATMAIAAPVVATPATVWITFGNGNATSVQTGINSMYGFKTGAGGESINGVRKFVTAGHTVSGVEDTDGNVIATLTAITDNLTQSGYDANVTPEISYAPDPEMDAYMSNVTSGDTVQFSLNTLTVGEQWDITIGCIYPYDSATNPIDVDVNGEVGIYNCSDAFHTNVTVRATVDSNGKLIFSLTHPGAPNNGTARGGIAFIEMIKVV